MQRLDSKLMFTVPLEEDHILSKKPLMWAIGDVIFESQLLSYEQFKNYTQLTNIIKLRDGHNTEIELRAFLQMLAKKDKPEELAFLLNAIIEHKKMYGIIPGDIVDVILSFTEIQDNTIAYNTIEQLWINNQNSLFVTMEEFLKPEIKRDLLRWFIAHNVSIQDCYDLIVSIEKANTEIKKKLVEPPAPPQKALSRHKLLDIFLKNQKQRITDSKKFR